MSASWTGNGADLFTQTYTQLFEEERRLRLAAEEKVAAYAGVLEELARALAPVAVEARRHEDPHYFEHLDPDGWRAFFHQVTAAKTRWGVPLNEPDTAQLLRELDWLRQERERLLALLANSRTERGQAQQSEEQITRPAPSSPPARPGPRLSLPALPTAPLPQVKALFSQKHMSWPRSIAALAITALSGWSSQRSLEEELAAHERVSPGAGSIRRLFTRLASVGLLETYTFNTDSGKLIIATLSASSRELLSSIGITPVVSEWERLIPQRPPLRAALICGFAYQVRRRGFEIEIMPSEACDAVLRRGNESVSVLVPVSDGDVEQQTLQQMVRKQGFVALCAPSPATRAEWVASCQRWGWPGRATDLVSLKRAEDQGDLWLDVWDS